MGRVKIMGFEPETKPGESTHKCMWPPCAARVVYNVEHLAQGLSIPRICPGHVQDVRRWSSLRAGPTEKEFWRPPTLEDWVTLPESARRAAEALNEEVRTWACILGAANDVRSGFD